MKQLLSPVLAVLSSRITSPLVICLFLLAYVGIAFFTEDALTALIAFTGNNVFLAAVFALLPLNSAGRMFFEAKRHMTRYRLMAGHKAENLSGLFEEELVLPSACSLKKLKGRLDSFGYKTFGTESTLFAWQGVSIFPARLLYLAASFCLYAGILISLTSRVSTRGAVVEGEPLPLTSGEGGIVSRIVFEKASGLILSDDLLMEVVAPGSGDGKTTFGIYPPSRYNGAFIYPRYLGVGLLVRLAAPDLPGGFEKHCALSIYPAGKEASVDIPGAPYRIVFSLAQPADGTDPYRTGRMSFLFKLIKGKDVLFTGSAPTGGEFVHDGYRIAFPDARRLVITDFIKDNGVPLIWGAFMLFALSVIIWLPARLFAPRREMLFINFSEGFHSFSRAEGRRRNHEEVFHEALDLLEAGERERFSVSQETS